MPTTSFLFTGTLLLSLRLPVSSLSQALIVHHAGSLASISQALGEGKVGDSKLSGLLKTTTPTLTSFLHFVFYLSTLTQ
jgi:hypothetical protein